MIKINSKSEARNSKQIRMTEKANPKKDILKKQTKMIVSNFCYSNFEFVSDFDIRASNLRDYTW